MHPYRASDLPENPKPTWLDTVRVIVMAVLFLPVSLARFLWKYAAPIVITILIVGFLVALAVNEHEEHQRFSEECIRRGGFAMRTQDGSHCLDKSLAK